MRRIGMLETVERYSHRLAATGLLIGLLSGLSIGCQAVEESVHHGVLWPMGEVKRLPAYPLAGERSGGGKADMYDDIRNSNPEFYSITVPSSRENLRGMVEWEPMSALLLSITSWVSSSSALRDMYVDLVFEASAVTTVWVMYADPPVRQVLENALVSVGVDMTRVRWLPQPVESVWAVDYGPFPLVDPSTNTQAFSDFVYYHGRPYDDAIPTRLGLDLGATTYRAPLIFEGGNIQTDGEGRCFTTQRGLQYSGLPQATFDGVLRDYVGCAQLVFLKDVTDDATGHVDMFFKLLSPTRAVLGSYPPGLDDVNKARMDDNAAILSVSAGVSDIYRLPMPGYGSNAESFPGVTKTKVPFTYANSTLVNGINLWPVYSNPEWADSRDEAATIWAEALPSYTHVEITADEIALSSGAIHCITRTIPSVSIEKWLPDGTCVNGACEPPPGFEDLASTTTCVDDDVCIGPAWECACNDCRAECPVASPVPDTCSGISFAGCCDGDVLIWCEEGQLRQQACATNSCGFAPSLGYYSCGTEGLPATDSSLPLSCNSNDECEPSCDRRACGTDGCGGTCGACSSNEVCEAGSCVYSESTTAGDDSGASSNIASGNETAGACTNGNGRSGHSLPIVILVVFLVLAIRCSSDCFDKPLGP